MLSVFAIDPGPVTSGWIWFQDQPELCRFDCGNTANTELRQILSHAAETPGVVPVIERIALYQKADINLHNTILWYGRFLEICEQADRPAYLLYRSTIRCGLLDHSKGNDSSIVAYLKDRFGWSPKRKANPYPFTTGITNHTWQALAAGIYWLDLYRANPDYVDQYRFVNNEDQSAATATRAS